MNKFALRAVINAISLIVISYITSAMIVDGIFAALAAGLVLGVVNAIIRPVLMILSLPLNILTLGLFTFVINTLMLKLTATFVNGFSTGGFFGTFFAAILLSVVSAIISSLLGEKPEKNKA